MAEPTTKTADTKGTPKPSPTNKDAASAAAATLATAPEHPTTEDPDYKSDLDALAGLLPTAKPEVTGQETPPSRQAPVPVTPSTDSGQPADLPHDEPDESHTFAKVPDLRKEFNARSKKLKTLEAELERVRAESSKTPKDDPEKADLSRRVTELQKKVDSAEIELRYANYTRSREYMDKFAKPMEEAIASMYELAQDFDLTLEDGSTRKVQTSDVDALLSMSPRQSWEAANKIFGPAAGSIMHYWNRVKELRKAGIAEAKKYQEIAQSRDREAESASAARAEQLRALWNQTNETMVKQYPQFFAPDENDAEATDWLKKGYAYVDRVFQPNGMLPEERIRLEADVRHRAAAFGRVLYMLKKTKAQLAEKEAALEEYRSSEPGKGAKDGGDSPKKKDDVPDFNSDFEEMAKGG